MKLFLIDLISRPSPSSVWCPSLRQWAAVRTCQGLLQS